nr:hypothetical protein [Tanacetum cinerariifolium]
MCAGIAGVMIVGCGGDGIMGESDRKCEGEGVAGWQENWLCHLRGESYVNRIQGVYPLCRLTSRTKGAGLCWGRVGKMMGSRG